MILIVNYEEIVYCGQSHVITRFVKMIRGSLSYNEVEVLVNGFYMMYLSKRICR